MRITPLSLYIIINDHGKCDMMKQARFQSFPDARMWTKGSPQELDIIIFYNQWLVSKQSCQQSRKLIISVKAETCQA